MEATVQTKTPVTEEPAPRVGVYVCHCGLNIAQTVDCKKVAETASGLEGVVISKDVGYIHGDDIVEIDAMSIEKINEKAGTDVFKEAHGKSAMVHVEEMSKLIL